MDMENDIKSTLAEASEMFLVLSSIAKNNQQFDMRYKEKELSDMSGKLMAHLRELYQQK